MCKAMLFILQKNVYAASKLNEKKRKEKRSKICTEENCMKVSFFVPFYREVPARTKSI